MAEGTIMGKPETTGPGNDFIDYGAGTDSNVVETDNFSNWGPSDRCWFKE